MQTAQSYCPGTRRLGCVCMCFEDGLERASFLDQLIIHLLKQLGRQSQALPAFFCIHRIFCKF